MTKTVVMTCLLLLAPAASWADDVADINKLLDAWHHAAAVADEDVFFGSMAPGAIYLGTDASERWVKEDFVEWSATYFERESAWAFTPYNRNVYLTEDGNHAWFEEYLKTWMGVCGGSGVLERTSEGWKLKHYHLAVTVPNERIREFMAVTDNPADHPSTEEHKVLQTVVALFDGMRAGDANAVAAVHHEDARAIRINRSTGSSEIASMDTFLDLIRTSTPGSLDERMTGYEVRIDGMMATAWVPYTFYLADELSHCGVNAVQLLKVEGEWKIIQTTFTRGSEGCEEPGADE